MIRRLTSSPKPAVRVAAVHLARGRRVDPQAVAHPVVAGQVAGRLGRSDQVVGGQAVGERRHLHVHDRRPAGAQGVEGLLRPLQHVGRRWGRGQGRRWLVGVIVLLAVLLLPRLLPGPDANNAVDSGLGSTGDGNACDDAEINSIICGATEDVQGFSAARTPTTNRPRPSSSRAAPTRNADRPRPTRGRSTARSTSSCTSTWTSCSSCSSSSGRPATSPPNTSSPMSTAITSRTSPGPATRCATPSSRSRSERTNGASGSNCRPTASPASGRTTPAPAVSSTTRPRSPRHSARRLPWVEKSAPFAQPT